MRGKRGDGSSSRRAGRIIPAHAGQTWFKAGDAINSPDHPRACGANKNDARSSLPLAGSSPRMRGKLLRREPREAINRIIPAHAGQTCNHGQLAEPVPDHPRACGANAAHYRKIAGGVGSSPRMRGKPRGCNAPPTRFRIIPAHAGQTRSPPLMLWSCPDHPRACGANISLITGMSMRNGSSPRMRGKRTVSHDGVRYTRIIPAHAGQTFRYRLSGHLRSDHPRACGANGTVSPFYRVSPGSSPRMRGKLGVGHVFG